MITSAIIKGSDPIQHFDLNMVSVAQRVEARANWEFCCAGCGEPLKIWAAEDRFVKPHYHHDPDSDCGLARKYSRLIKNPSLHNDGKVAALTFLTTCGNYNGALYQSEYFVENKWAEDIDKGWQFIDIAQFLPDGRKYAHEIQLSNQTVGEFKKRTEIYKASGFDVVWWLGGNADTETNQQWADDNGCLSGHINVQRGRRIVGGVSGQDIKGWVERVNNGESY